MRGTLTGGDTHPGLARREPLQGPIAGDSEFQELQQRPYGRARSDTTLNEMSRLVRDLQLGGARSHKYDERQRFLEAVSIRIRTLKCRAERWREVPVPPDLLRALELVHALRSAPTKAADRPFWPWSRATAHLKIARIMADAGIDGPQACPNGLRHGYGIAAVAADVPCRSRRSRPP